MTWTPLACAREQPAKNARAQGPDSPRPPTRRARVWATAVFRRAPGRSPGSRPRRAGLRGPRPSRCCTRRPAASRRILEVATTASARGRTSSMGRSPRAVGGVRHVEEILAGSAPRISRATLRPPTPERRCRSAPRRGAALSPFHSRPVSPDPAPYPNRRVGRAAAGRIGAVLVREQPALAIEAAPVSAQRHPRRSHDGTGSRWPRGSHLAAPTARTASSAPPVARPPDTTWVVPAGSSSALPRHGAGTVCRRCRRAGGPAHRAGRGNSPGAAPDVQRVRVAGVDRPKRRPERREDHSGRPRTTRRQRAFVREGGEVADGRGEAHGGQDDGGGLHDTMLLQPRPGSVRFATRKLPATTAPARDPHVDERSTAGRRLLPPVDATD